MMRWIRLSMCLVTTSLIVLIALPGCTPKNDPSKVKDKEKDKDKDKTKDKDKEKPHDHAETGPHGGPLADWDDVYHAEFTADNAAKMVVVYILDEKAKKAPAVEASRFSKVKLAIPSEKITLELTHDAKKSGEHGIVYTGTHDFFTKATAFKGNLSAVVDEKDQKKAKPYSNDFEFDPKKHSGEKK